MLFLLDCRKRRQWDSVLSRFPYDAVYEKGRKEKEELILTRNPEQLKEEEYLVGQLKVIEDSLKAVQREKKRTIEAALVQ